MYMFGINYIFCFAVLCVFDLAEGLATLPKVDENDIAKTESVIRKTTNALFSSLKLKNIQSQKSIKQFSLIHNYFISLTLQDYSSLKEIAKLTRVNKSDIENETTNFIALLNEILDEENVAKLETILMDEDIGQRYEIQNEIEKLIYLKKMHTDNKNKVMKINKDVLKILQDDKTLDLNVTSPTTNSMENSNENVLDENIFWHETDMPLSGRRIFDGQRTKIKHYPFMASIQIFNKFQCAGSIIKSDLVITAASCLQLAWNNRFYRENPPFLSVRVGSSFYEFGGERIGVQEIYFYPGYNPQNLHNNLALIRLERKLKLYKKSKKVKKIHIDKFDHKLSNTAGRIEILGWGATSLSNKLHGPFEDKLKHAILNIYPHDDCQQLYSREFVTKKHFCGGYISKGTGACNRDIGGPGLVSGILTGVISFGAPSCGLSDAPTVFTKLGFYYDWIEDIMEQEVPVFKKKTTIKPITWSYPLTSTASTDWYLHPPSTKGLLQHFRTKTNVTYQPISTTTDITNVDKDLFKDYLTTVFETDEKQDYLEIEMFNTNDLTKTYSQKEEFSTNFMSQTLPAENSLLLPTSKGLEILPLIEQHDNYSNNLANNTTSKSHTIQNLPVELITQKALPMEEIQNQVQLLDTLVAEEREKREKYIEHHLRQIIDSTTEKDNKVDVSAKIVSDHSQSLFNESKWENNNTDLSTQIRKLLDSSKLQDNQKHSLIMQLLTTIKEKDTFEYQQEKTKTNQGNTNQLLEDNSGDDKKHDLAMLNIMNPHDPLQEMQQHLTDKFDQVALIKKEYEEKPEFKIFRTGESESKQGEQDRLQNQLSNIMQVLTDEKIKDKEKYDLILQFLSKPYALLQNNKNIEKTDNYYNSEHNLDMIIQKQNILHSPITKLNMVPINVLSELQHDILRTETQKILEIEQLENKLKELSNLVVPVYNKVKQSPLNKTDDKNIDNLKFENYMEPHKHKYNDTMYTTKDEYIQWKNEDERELQKNILQVLNFPKLEDNKKENLILQLIHPHNTNHPTKNIPRTQNKDSNEGLERTIMMVLMDSDISEQQKYDILLKFVGGKDERYLLNNTFRPLEHIRTTFPISTTDNAWTQKDKVDKILEHNVEMALMDPFLDDQQRYNYIIKLLTSEVQYPPTFTKNLMESFTLSEPTEDTIRNLESDIQLRSGIGISDGNAMKVTLLNKDSFNSSTSDIYGSAIFIGQPTTSKLDSMLEYVKSLNPYIVNNTTQTQDIKVPQNNISEFSTKYSQNFYKANEFATQMTEYSIGNTNLEGSETTVNTGIKISNIPHVDNILVDSSQLQTNVFEDKESQQINNPLNINDTEIQKVQILNDSYQQIANISNDPQYSYDNIILDDSSPLRKGDTLNQNYKLISNPLLSEAKEKQDISIFDKISQSLAEAQKYTADRSQAFLIQSKPTDLLSAEISGIAGNFNEIKNNIETVFKLLNLQKANTTSNNSNSDYVLSEPIFRVNDQPIKHKLNSYQKTGDVVEFEKNNNYTAMKVYSKLLKNKDLFNKKAKYLVNSLLPHKKKNIRLDNYHNDMLSYKNLLQNDELSREKITRILLSLMPIERKENELDNTTVKEYSNLIKNDDIIKNIIAQILMSLPHNTNGTSNGKKNNNNVVHTDMKQDEEVKTKNYLSTTKSLLNKQTILNQDVFIHYNGNMSPVQVYASKKDAILLSSPKFTHKSNLTVRESKSTPVQHIKITVLEKTFPTTEFLPSPPTYRKGTFLNIADTFYGVLSNSVNRLTSAIGLNNIGQANQINHNNKTYFRSKNTEENHEKVKNSTENKKKKHKNVMQYISDHLFGVPDKSGEENAATDLTLAIHSELETTSNGKWLYSTKKEKESIVHVLENMEDKENNNKLLSSTIAHSQVDEQEFELKKIADQVFKILSNPGAKSEEKHEAMLDFASAIAVTENDRNSRLNFTTDLNLQNDIMQNNSNQNLKHIESDFLRTGNMAETFIGKSDENYDVERNNAFVKFINMNSLENTNVEPDNGFNTFELGNSSKLDFDFLNQEIDENLRKWKMEHRET